MSEKPIEKMDFKELREAVQIISDNFEKYKRIVDDAMENLDSSNFSKQFLVEYGGMRSQIKMTTKAIESMVTDTDLLEELEKYSTIVQTAEQIELAVVRANSATDDKLKEYSTITQTADAIKTVVAEETAGFVSDTDLETELKKYSTIEQTASDISAAVSSERAYITSMLEDDYYTQEEVDSKITVSADGVLLDVSKVYKTITASDSDIVALGERIDSTDADVVNLQSCIDINADEIAAIVSGQYTDELLQDYFTGIVISPNSIKMQDNNMYSVYNSQGLRFYGTDGQIEGWAIEPDILVGGVLNYYVNSTSSYRFGPGESGDGYSNYDMVLKSVSSNRGRFVVDVTNSGNKEVKFVGLNSDASGAPYIYANEKLLATQDWVLSNAGGSGGTTTVVFG